MGMKDKTSDMRVMIAAGGTGGHIYPGIAIADEIKRARPGCEIVFVGTKRGLETKILPGLGFGLVLIGSTSIKDRKGLVKILAFARIPFSMLRALGILIAKKPCLLVSIGGYAAGPFSLAAWVLRIPFVLVEPNAIAGFTNRMIGRFAKMAFVGFSGAQKYFPAGRSVLSGNPVRREVLNVPRRGVFDGSKLTIFVFGGSQGARRINQAVIRALPFLRDEKNRIFFIHQTGVQDNAVEIKQAYVDAGVNAEVFSFTDKIWESYGRADLVIARAGAISTAELAAISMPSILVPYPFAADDHQRANAEAMEETGGATMVPDAECTGERIAGEIKKILERPEKLTMMKLALEKMQKRNAANFIAEESLKLIK